MDFVEDIQTLEALYGDVAPAAVRKVARRMTPLYRAWIMASRFCILTTIGPEGTDGSPRGDDGPVVTELDAGTLAMPDWRGNNRLDSLRNIVSDGRVSLLFLVPGSTGAVRVNGRARLTADAGLRQRFARNDRLPATVIVIDIGEIYIQCARALMRARTWGDMAPPEGLPTVGQILAEMTDGAVGGAEYDRAWPERAAQSLW